jgi:hypothetical protein
MILVQGPCKLQRSFSLNLTRNYIIWNLIPVWYLPFVPGSPGSPPIIEDLIELWPTVIIRRLITAVRPSLVNNLRGKTAVQS